MGTEVTLYLRLFCVFGLRLNLYLPFQVEDKKLPISKCAQCVCSRLRHQEAVGLGVQHSVCLMYFSIFKCELVENHQNSE